jgi:hypothetical protein
MPPTTGSGLLLRKIVCIKCSCLGSLNIQRFCSYKHQEKSECAENGKRSSHGQRADAEWIQNELIDVGFIHDAEVFSKATE